MATYSSILAWRIPGTGQPGGLPSMGSHRVGHDWNEAAAAATVRMVGYFLLLHCSESWKYHSVMPDSLRPHRLYSPWNSPGQNIRVGCLSLLHEIFQTQGSNPGLPHCRQFLYLLSHQGSPRILEWVAYSFSRGSSRPRDWTGVSCLTRGFFTNWHIRNHIVLYCFNLYPLWWFWSLSCTHLLGPHVL